MSVPRFPRSIWSIPFFIATIANAVVNADEGAVREWKDGSGNYKVNAQLIARDAKSVVLRKDNGELITLPIADLSTQDSQYLQSQEDESSALPKSTQTFRLKSGISLRGKIVDFHEHDITIQRRLGRIYVNHKWFDRLPKVYRNIVPHIVEHFTKKRVVGEKGLQEWVLTLKGQPRTFRCQGLLVELDDQHLYCIPFFLFSDESVKSLRPGWERWLNSQEDDERREHESYLLRAQARAYEMQKQQQLRQIQQLQLNLQAYDAGLVDLWEVSMFPATAAYGVPLSVVVPARNSQQAAEPHLCRRGSTSSAAPVGSGCAAIPD